MTTHEIAGIPIKDENGNLIGKGKLEIDDEGNVRAHIALDTYLGRRLMSSMESGTIEGLTLRPNIIRSMKAVEYVSLGEMPPNYYRRQAGLPNFPQPAVKLDSEKLEHTMEKLQRSVERLTRIVDEVFKKGEG